MKVIEFLDKNSAEYEVSHHRSVFTAQQMAAEEHVPGMNVAKPVIINVDGEHFMCVLPACCKVDTDAMKRHLGAEKIELAEESEMAKLFPDCALGAEPPFGNLYGLVTIMDDTLEEDKYIVFQGGTHEDSIRMELQDFKKLVQPRTLSFSYHRT
jgi:Ala-tRNA(Pro) deacylase